MKLKFKLEVLCPTEPHFKHVVCLRKPYKNNSWVRGDIALADTRKPLHPPRAWAWLEFKKIG